MKFWGTQFSDKAIFQCKKPSWLDFNFQAITKNIGPYRREYDIHRTIVLMDVNGIFQHFLEIKDGSEARGYHDPLFVSPARFTRLLEHWTNAHRSSLLHGSQCHFAAGW